jgi:hypothetical protein
MRPPDRHGLVQAEAVLNGKLGQRSTVSDASKMLRQPTGAILEAPER